MSSRMISDFLSDPVVKAYVFYSTVVLGKTLVMSLLTSLTRIRKKAFATQEDVKIAGGKVKTDDEDVERVRRCHLNDLENVLPFVLLGGFYCLTHPAYTTALWHFRIFAVSRILHTIVYLSKTPQPARGLCFAVGAVACVSMALRVLSSVW